ncbi:hypothetical protein BH10BAC4_BH10BAC4_10170 [soil metagenome]
MQFKELPRLQFEQFLRNPDIVKFPLVNAVANSKQSGRIFTNGLADLFIIHKANFSFGKVTSGEESTNQLIKLFETGNNIPKYFHLYSPDSMLVNQLEALSDLFNLRKRNRIQLRYSKNSIAVDSAFKLGDEYKVEIIDDVNFDQLGPLEIDLAQKFWDSKSDFLKNGVGVCVMRNDRVPVSVCYSACLVDRVAEIDIKTAVSFQKMGFGEIVAREFVKLAIGRGIIPNWDCFDDNYASIATATKVGFESINEYQFVSVFNKRNQS